VKIFRLADWRNRLKRWLDIRDQEKAHPWLLIIGETLTLNGRIATVDAQQLRTTA
jgi:hypothetical protein